MAVRTFAIETPAQLRRIADFFKGDTDISPIIASWSESRKKRKKNQWDGHFFASFSHTREQIGILYYVTSTGEEVTVGRLRYLTAMHWCEGQLRLKDRVVRAADGSARE